MKAFYLSQAEVAKIVDMYMASGDWASAARLCAQVADQPSTLAAISAGLPNG